MLDRISSAAKLATGLSLAIAAVGAFAQSAQAGAYRVYSCRTPTGQSAPADGWSGSVAAGGAYDDYAIDTCTQGGALIAALGDVTVHAAAVDMATWAFEAPAGTTIAEGTLWRAGYLRGTPEEKATYQFWLAGPRQSDVLDECIFTLGCMTKGNLVQPLSVQNQLVLPAKLGSRLYISTSCGVNAGQVCQQNAGDANGYAAAVYLYAADLKLEQNAGPSAGNVSGELATAPVVRGSSDVAFSATDPGAGVYEAVFSVDGQVVQSTVVDENGGHCRNVGQTGDGLAAFLYVKPCQAAVSADVAFDSTSVSNGSHHLIVSVIDAAGNAAPVLDRQITVSNTAAPCVAAGPANGTNASAQATLTANWKGTRKQRLTSGYARSLTVVGRLAGPGGVPIAGASIDVLATPAHSGGKPVAMASPRTGPNGSFGIRLAGGVSSRTLRLSYCSHLGPALPAAARTLTLSVRAGIALRVAPRVSGIGGSIFFHGRLLGGPYPAAGKQLVLEARSPGSAWIEFKVVRTDARGRYRASYRFKFPGPVAYQFRVLSEPESDYPFAAGVSNVVGVFER